MSHFSYKKSSCKFLHLFFLSIMGFLCVPINAQNNRYKIDDRVFNGWEKISAAVRTERLVHLVDSVFYLAKDIGDVKGQCLVLTMLPLHYYYTGELDSLKLYKDSVGSFAGKTPYKQYVFDSWNRLINYYLNKGKYTAAFKELDAYNKKASELQNEYGIVHGYRKFGDVYYSLRDYDMAITQYEKCISMAQGGKSSSDLYDVFTGLGSIYMLKRDFPKAIEYYKQANTARLSLNNKAYDPLAKLVSLSCLSNDTTAIDFYWNEFNQASKVEGAYLRTSGNKELATALYEVFKGNVEEAIKIGPLVKDLDMRLLLFDYIGQKNKDYYVPYLISLELLNIQRSFQAAGNRNLLANMMEQVDRMELQRANEELELSNMQMSLQEAKNRQNLIETENERSRLLLSNKQLELEQQQALNELNISEKLKANALAQSEHEKALRQRDRAIMLEKDGELQMLRLNLVAGFALLGFIFFLIIMLRDRAQKKVLLKQKIEAEKAREIANQEKFKAQSADKLKSLFLQNMSHEIRTPLNAIVGFNQLLNGEGSEDFSKEEKDEFVKVINSNSDLLLTLVNDILDLSKLESGTYKVNNVLVNIKELCLGISRSIESKIPNNVEFKMSIPQENVNITTDQQRLQQVLINFLTNACKYTEQGSITLAYEVRDFKFDYCNEEIPALIFSVTDTGCGIKEEDCNKVFERFEKLDSFKPGTGLGLNICYRISKLLKGKVFVDSTYKQGARFVFALPLDKK